MNAQEGQIADIHVPMEVSMWPPAYGWWIVLLLVLITLFTVFKLVRKWRKNRVQRNFALDELKAVNLEHYAAWQQINEIMKRAAMVYYPRTQVAALTGEKWKAFLLEGLGKKTASKMPEFDDNWLNFAYTPVVDQQQVQSYHQFAQVWLTKGLLRNKPTAGATK
ncbi:MAG: DUF4381 domain-containing protein [Psychrosphaera sp.]|nr:DUF4381 domain-containing protein [Psychrosphaera sp.]